MKTELQSNVIIDAIKQHLIVADKQFFDDGKHLRYVDYSGKPRKLTRKDEKNEHQKEN